VRLADVFAEREMVRVPGNDFPYPGLTWREADLRGVLNLREHRIRIDQHADGNASIFVAQEGGARYVYDHVRRATYVANGLVRHTKAFAGGLVAVGPAVGHAEIGHYPVQVGHEGRAIGRAAVTVDVERPQARIFYVVRVVPQRTETSRVLHVV